MADFQNDFVPAFPYPIKWSIGDNTFDDSDKNPKAIGLAIAVDSIPGLINHLMALEADTSKHKQGKVWSKENEKRRNLLSISMVKVEIQTMDMVALAILILERSK